jgi:penicillin-binding protein 2
MNLRLQRLADALLEPHSGVLIVMDPRTGAILTLASKPDYDPNFPMRGIPSGEASSYNKAIRGRYAPGSTFKIVTAAAGLHHGYDPTVKIHCSGRYRLPNVRRAFHCDLRWGHGPLDLEEAIQRSCNIYFYTWGDRLGHERLYETARQFGFGQPSGIDLIPTEFETLGDLPPPGTRGIYRGSVVQMGIGQGALISATPLQILGAYAVLARDGTRVRPHVLDSVISPEGQLLYRHEPEILGRVPLSDAHLDLLREGFFRVVHRQGGTGFNKGFQSRWQVAGKTGSSEVAGQELTDGLFVAYAPAHDPVVAMIGIVEAEGHGGSTALPLIVQLMAEYFEPGTGVPPVREDAPEIAAASPPVPPEPPDSQPPASASSATAPPPPPARGNSVSHILPPVR